MLKIQNDAIALAQQQSDDKARQMELAAQREADATMVIEQQRMQILLAQQQSDAEARQREPETQQLHAAAEESFRRT